jgi:predicted ABC-type sugar transport system permease subunit
MLVCRSVAEIVKLPSLISKRKFSSIGKTVLLLDAPLTVCKCFKSVDVDTINLIIMIWSILKNIKITLHTYTCGNNVEKLRTILTVIMVE